MVGYKVDLMLKLLFDLVKLLQSCLQVWMQEVDNVELI